MALISAPVDSFGFNIYTADIADFDEKGDYVLNENDVLSNRVFEDAIAYGGRHLDAHRPEGFYALIDDKVAEMRVENNHQGHSVINKTVLCDEIRITVNKTHGYENPRICEIRVY